MQVQKAVLGSTEGPGRLACFCASVDARLSTGGLNMNHIHYAAVIIASARTQGTACATTNAGCQLLYIYFIDQDEDTFPTIVAMRQISKHRCMVRSCTLQTDNKIRRQEHAKQQVAPDDIAGHHDTVRVKHHQYKL